MLSQGTKNKTCALCSNVYIHMKNICMLLLFQLIIFIYMFRYIDKYFTWECKEETDQSIYDANKIPWMLNEKK